jgi:hypothetical protein
MIISGCGETSNLSRAKPDVSSGSSRQWSDADAHLRDDKLQRDWQWPLDDVCASGTEGADGRSIKPTDRNVRRDDC